MLTWFINELGFEWMVVSSTKLMSLLYVLWIMLYPGVVSSWTLSLLLILLLILLLLLCLEPLYAKFTCPNIVKICLCKSKRERERERERIFPL